MKRFKVAWYYAMQQRDPETRLATDPRRSGGEYTYEKESEAEALKQLEIDLSTRGWAQPFDASLIDASAWELLGASDYLRDEIVDALRLLDADELAALIADVQRPAPLPADAASGERDGD